MKQELRVHNVVLALFHYFFSGPLVSTLSTLTLGEASLLWKVIEAEFVSWSGVSQISLYFSYATSPLSPSFSPSKSLCLLEKQYRLPFGKLWDDVAELFEKREEGLGRRVWEQKESCAERLKKVFQEWTKEEDALFQGLLQVGLGEVRKIASEYLGSGVLATVPDHMKDLPADNLEHERYFAVWKKDDTHANHYAPATQEGRQMVKENMVQREPQVMLGEESQQKLRSLAFQTPSQRKIDRDLAEQRQQKWKEDDAKEEEKGKRKRKREESLENELQATKRVHTKEDASRLTSEALRLQLYLQKSIHPGKKINVGGSKDERLDRLLKLL